MAMLKLETSFDSIMKNRPPGSPARRLRGSTAAAKQGRNVQKQTGQPLRAGRLFSKNLWLFSGVCLDFQQRSTGFFSRTVRSYCFFQSTTTYFEA
jgi:hypothetical protein